MKTCPVCNAVAFDDQVTCYGCLHGFEEEEQPEEKAGVGVDTRTNPGAALFLLSLVPHAEASGFTNWTCTVEPMASAQSITGTAGK